MCSERAEKSAMEAPGDDDLPDLEHLEGISERRRHGDGFGRVQPTTAGMVTTQCVEYLLKYALKKPE